MIYFLDALDIGEHKSKEWIDDIRDSIWFILYSTDELLKATLKDEADYI